MPDLLKVAIKWVCVVGRDAHHALSLNVRHERPGICGKVGHLWRA